MISVCGVASTPGTPNDIAAAAHQQIGVTTRYDPSYRDLAYPGGDVPVEVGACTDVIVRALRNARHIDLQREVHEDMLANRAAYPKRWFQFGSAVDSSIDHRRVPNLMVYFSRRGYALPISAKADDYRPGDIVAWNLSGSTLHIGIVSNKRDYDGYPLMIHNIGRGVEEEPILFQYKIIGHYRVPTNSTSVHH
jgi:uncharacterized protein YijF (DUF1287 family)